MPAHVINAWDGTKWVPVALGQSGQATQAPVQPQRAPQAQTGGVQFGTGAWASSPIFWLVLGASVWAFRDPLIELIGVGEAAAVRALKAARQKIDKKKEDRVERKPAGALPVMAKAKAKAKKEEKEEAEPAAETPADFRRIPMEAGD